MTPAERGSTTDRRQILHMVGNAHLDPVWLWDWREGYAEVRATFRAALDLMDEVDDFVFTADSVCYLAWLEENDADLFERVRARIEEGRWVPVGGWWIEPDCNIPSGESFVRQGLYGQRYLRDRFGRTARVGMNVDPFGHNAMLPQILQKMGISGYVFHRPGPHEKALPGPLFWWRSPDGSSVLAYRIPHEYCSQPGALSLHVDKTIALLPAGWSELMCFYGVGDHGGGPTREDLATIRRIDAIAGQPHLALSSPERFFDRVLVAGRPDELPIVDGELQHHAVGCYSAYSAIKALNRRAEQALLSAEVWAVVAERAHGVSYPAADLTHAWKQVLFNQFHDILAGTAIESTYVDARDQLGEASSIAARVTNRSIQAIARAIDLPAIAGTWPVIVFNSHAWPVRSDVEMEFGSFHAEARVTDENGRPLPVQRARSEAIVPGRRRLVFTADLPALGFRVYRIWPVGLETGRPSGIPASAAADVRAPVAIRRSSLRATETSLENAHLRVDVDRATGWLASLIDKAAPGANLANPAAPHAVVIDDPSDTWSHRIATYGRVEGSFGPRSVRLIERGPVRAVLRITSVYGGSTLVEDLILGADSRELEVRVTLDWFERFTLLKLRIATALTGVTATFEIPYGHLERVPNGQEEPGQSWVDVTGALPDGGVAGVSVLNDGKYAFDIRDGDVGITVVRSPAFAWHDPEAIEPEDDLAIQDQGRQRFVYSVRPHRGDWREAGTVRAAAQLNRRPMTLLESAHPGSGPTAMSYARSDPPSIVITVIKGAEDANGDVVIRAHESAGLTADATIELPFLGRTIRRTFGPHEIATLRIPNDSHLDAFEADLLEDPVMPSIETVSTQPEGGSTT